MATINREWCFEPSYGFKTTNFSSKLNPWWCANINETQNNRWASYFLKVHCLYKKTRSKYESNANIINV